jgi:protocatechuate 3,4-dioxygenase beta subunit
LVNHGQHAGSPKVLPADPPLSVCFAQSRRKGPYFVDEELRRSDIRPDPATGEIKPGVPLVLTVALSRADQGRCQPLPGAQVDIWHCDADGLYSDVKDPDSI